MFATKKTCHRRNEEISSAVHASLSMPSAPSSPLRLFTSSPLRVFLLSSSSYILHLSSFIALLSSLLNSSFFVLHSSNSLFPASILYFLISFFSKEGMAARLRNMSLVKAFFLWAATNTYALAIKLGKHVDVPVANIPTKFERDRALFCQQRQIYST